VKKTELIEKKVIPILLPTTSRFAPIGYKGSIDSLVHYNGSGLDEDPFHNVDVIPHHIYILSTDKVVIGDYVYDGTSIRKVVSIGRSYLFFGSGEPIRTSFGNKIIATSDKLIELPLIGNDILREFLIDFKGICGLIVIYERFDDNKFGYTPNDRFELEIDRIDKITDFEYISTTELMVGNYVYDNEYLLRISTGDEIEFSEEYLPIKVTEYWLNKLNFKKIDEGRHKCSYKNLLIEFKKGEYRLYISDVIKGCKVLVRRVKYVHEIQNAYQSIIGVELDPVRDINDKWG
jgi:hypothetical protein